MGSLAPPSSFPASSSSSLLLPTLIPAVDEWFISTNYDHLLTQALTLELSSTERASASSAASSSKPSLEPSASSAFLQSNGCPPLQAQVGSPVSSSSICKEMPESPFSCVSGMTPNFSSATESFLTQNYEDPLGKFHEMSSLKTSTHTPASITSPISSSALSSQASAGAGASKVSKRRPRTNKKAPIAILSANTSNFRAMVQQLTGIPTSHIPSPFWGTRGAPLLKPQPTKLPYNGGSLDLPTLDTSASFLSSKITPSTQNFSFLQQGASQKSGHQPLSGSFLGQPCNAAELAYFQDRSKSFLGNGYQPNMINYEALLSSSSSSSSLPVLLDAMDSGKLSGTLARGSLKQLLSPNIMREGDQSATVNKQASNPFEILHMSDDDPHSKMSYNTVDSWLAFDGGALANHSPRIDLAKVVS